MADGKVSRRERGLLVFTCCTRHRDKVAVVNYMIAEDEGNLEVRVCVLFTILFYIYISFYCTTSLITDYKYTYVAINGM